MNLDDNALFSRFGGNVFNANDSQAIMVGAGNSVGHSPACFSNFGSRINVQGWGDSIYTLGYGDIRAGGPDRNQFYTAQFGGTSGAAPMVAGAAANIQANRKALGLPVLTSTQMRSTLLASGTSFPASRNVGVLPNLRRAIAPLEPSATANMAAVQQTSTLNTLFSITQSGSLVRRTKTGTGAWQAPLGFATPGLLTFRPEASIATGFPVGTQLDVFAVSTGGTVWFSRSTSGGAWDTMAAVSSPGVLPETGFLATGLRNTNQLHVFFVNNSGTLVSYSVSGTGTIWTGPTTIAANFAPPGAPLATGRQGVTANTTNQLDVFAIGTDGALKVVWAVDGGGWNGPLNLTATGVAPGGGRVVTGRQGTDQLDVFYVGGNSLVDGVAVVNQGFWSAPFILHSTGFALPGSALSTAQHGPNNNTLDVFVLGSNNSAIGFLRMIDKGAWSTLTLIANTTGQVITSNNTSTAKRSTTLLDVVAIGDNGLSMATSTNGGSYSAFFKLP